MRRSLPLLARVLSVSLAAVAGCNLGAGASLGDAILGQDVVDAASDGMGDTGRDAEHVVRDGGCAEGWPEDGFEPRGGPLTFVVREIELTTERLCDFDGDGLLDNAVADAGVAAGSLIAGGVTSVIQGHIEDGARWLVHAPWVDDVANLTDPSFAAIFAGACESCCEPFGEGPDDFSDDWRGDESFCAHHTTLDPCGEPIFFSDDARLECGELRATGAQVPFFLTRHHFAMGRGASIWGTLPPGEGTAELTICAYSTIADLAALDVTNIPILSHVETGLALLVQGGAAFGMDAVPGVQPDVDLDGDGLERLEVDDDGRIARCVDGDDTVIEGADCPTDPRIADAFAVSSRQVLVSALFAGRQAGWETSVDADGCDAPPETSLFDPR